MEEGEVRVSGELTDEDCVESAYVDTVSLWCDFEPGHRGEHYDHRFQLYWRYSKDQEDAA
jgi:hypothetical protein